MLMILTLDLTQFPDKKYLQHIKFNEIPEILLLPTNDTHWDDKFNLFFLMPNSTYNITIKCQSDVVNQTIAINSIEPTQNLTFCTPAIKTIKITYLPLSYNTTPTCTGTVPQLHYGDICIISAGISNCIQENSTENSSIQIEIPQNQHFEIVYKSTAGKASRVYFKALLEIDSEKIQLAEFSTSNFVNFTLNASFTGVKMVNSSEEFALFTSLNYERQMGFLGQNVQKCGYFGIYEMNQCYLEAGRWLPEFKIYTILEGSGKVYFYSDLIGQERVQTVSSENIEVVKLKDGVDGDVVNIRYGQSLGFKTPECRKLLPEMELWIQLGEGMFWMRNREQVSCRFDQSCVVTEQYSDTCNL